MPMQPPHINGLIELTDTEASAIRTKLQEIQSRPPQQDEYGDEVPWSIFWTVATYNSENVGAEINGDTAEFLLN